MCLGSSPTRGAAREQAAQSGQWSLSLPLSRSMLPANIPGRTWQLRAVHAASSASTAPSPMRFERRSSPDGVDFAPLAGVKGVVTATPAAPVPNFQDDVWVIRGLPSVAAAVLPADRARELNENGLWLLAEYEEV